MTGQPLGVPTAPHSHLMWLAFMDPGHCDCSSLGQGLCADLPTCPPYMHFMRETPNGGCLNQNLRTLPREPPATGCSLPWASLPSSPTPSPSAPHQASQLPCRIPRAGWASFQYFCLEPWGQLQVAKAQMGLPCEYGVTYYGEAAQIHVHRTNRGSEAMTCLDNLGSSLWGLRSAASPLGLFPSPAPCPNDQGPDSPGI